MKYAILIIAVLMVINSALYGNVRNYKRAAEKPTGYAISPDRPVAAATKDGEDFIFFNEKGVKLRISKDRVEVGEIVIRDGGELYEIYNSVFTMRSDYNKDRDEWEDNQNKKMLEACRLGWLDNNKMTYLKKEIAGSEFSRTIGCSEQYGQPRGKTIYSDDTIEGELQ